MDISDILIYITVTVFAIHLIADGTISLNEDPESRMAKVMWRIIDFTSPSLVIIALVDIVFLLRTCC